MRRFQENLSKWHYLLGVLLLGLYLTDWDLFFIPSWVIQLAVVAYFLPIIFSSLKNLNTKGYVWIVIGTLLLFFGQSITLKIELWVMKYFHITVGNTNEELIDLAMQASPTVIFFFIVVIGPIFEEILFRLLLFRGMYEQSRVLAYVATSLLFGIIHVTEGVFVLGRVGELVYLITYCFMGVILAFLYDYNKNIATPVVAHILLNLSVTLINMYYA